MGGLFSRLRSLFFARNLELVLVGLANSGKTTFSNFLSTGRYVEEGPTVGLNVKVVQKGGDANNKQERAPLARATTEAGAEIRQQQTHSATVQRRCCISAIHPANFDGAHSTRIARSPFAPRALFWFCRPVPAPCCMQASR